MSIINAKIESTNLGYTDRGVSFWLNLVWQGTGQGFGGYNLRNVKVGNLAKLLDVVGVSYWEQLPGKVVRIEEGYHLSRIGNIIEDKWFNLATDLL